MGPAGPMGPKGDTGATGPQGPPGLSGLPPINRFTPTQIVRGAILTCPVTSVTTLASCSGGMKLNGLDVRLGSAEAGAICNAVTGAGFSTASGSGLADVPYFIWNGSNWALASLSVPPMDNLNCHLGAAPTGAVVRRSSTRAGKKVTILSHSRIHGRKGH